MRRRRFSSRAQRGQAIVEFALVVPLFLLLALALIDFSRLLFTYVSLTNGARELARSAAVTTNMSPTVIAAFNNLTLIGGPTDSAVDSVTITAVDPSGTSTSTTCPMPLNTATCSVPGRSATPTSSSAYSGGYVDVAATYRFVFNPLFEAPFGISFMRPLAVLSTSVRATVE
jgi:Flp pilus assembly protein TadG